MTINGDDTGVCWDDAGTEHVVLTHGRYNELLEAEALLRRIDASGMDYASWIDDAE